jgi:L-amino acid N-acyltransferase
MELSATKASRRVGSAGVSGIGVRLAGLDDAEAIRAIYNREVTGAMVTFDLVPRSLDDQRAWLAAHAGAHPAIVAVDSATGEVVGFGSLSPYRNRPAYSTTVEDSVYVHHDHRGRGVGRVVLAELVRLATVHGFHAMMARIVGGHEASIALHQACGFELVGVEKEVGRKFGRWLDVAVMQLLL